MKTYKYETHLHTIQGSLCGHSDGADYIEAFYKAGYSGIFVTDHFLGGNTAVPKEGKWFDRMDRYCSGYEAAFAKAQAFNKEKGLTGTDDEFKVFFGIEQTLTGTITLFTGLIKTGFMSIPKLKPCGMQSFLMQ